MIKCPKRAINDAFFHVLNVNFNNPFFQRDRKETENRNTDNDGWSGIQTYKRERDARDTQDGRRRFLWKVMWYSCCVCTNSRSSHQDYPVLLLRLSNTTTTTIIPDQNRNAPPIANKVAFVKSFPSSFLAISSLHNKKKVDS